MSETTVNGYCLQHGPFTATCPTCQAGAGESRVGSLGLSGNRKVLPDQPAPSPSSDEFRVGMGATNHPESFSDEEAVKIIRDEFANKPSWRDVSIQEAAETAVAALRRGGWGELGIEQGRTSDEREATRYWQETATSLVRERDELAERLVARDEELLISNAERDSARSLLRGLEEAARDFVDAPQDAESHSEWCRRLDRLEEALAAVSEVRKEQGW